MNMSWVNIEGRQHRLNMPCFVCCRAGTWPALLIKARDGVHGFTVTVCSEECFTMASLILLGMTHRELSEKVIMYRNTYFE